MSTRAVILGARGLLGRQLVPRLGRDMEVIPLDVDELDITDRELVCRVIPSYEADWVVNCAAFTQVDRCEELQDLAMTVNVEAVRSIAEACNQTKSVLVQMSSDYVFDGTGRRPYREDDPTNPSGIYAKSKWLSEEAARTCWRFLIVRTAWLYGPSGVSFVSKILERARRGDPLRVVNDQTGSPSYAPDVADGIARLMHVGAEGVFHVVNSKPATWYELARRVIELAGCTVSLEPVSSDSFASPAPRPAYSVLSCQRYTAATGHKLREWPSALEAFLRRETVGSSQPGERR